MTLLTHVTQWGNLTFTHMYLSKMFSYSANQKIADLLSMSIVESPKGGLVMNLGIYLYFYFSMTFGYILPNDITALHMVHIHFCVFSSGIWDPTQETCI